MLIQNHSDKARYLSTIFIDKIDPMPLSFKNEILYLVVEITEIFQKKIDFINEVKIAVKSTAVPKFKSIEKDDVLRLFCLYRCISKNVKNSKIHVQNNLHHIIDFGAPCFRNKSPAFSEKFQFKGEV
ncbi:MAG: hypothetical protein ACI88H_003421 [Cocleimonas sp.]|jgi:hypothetical protein